MTTPEPLTVEEEAELRRLLMYRNGEPIDPGSVIDVQRRLLATLDAEREAQAAMLHRADLVVTDLSAQLESAAHPPATVPDEGPLPELARDMATLAVASSPCPEQDAHERDLRYAFGPSGRFYRAAASLDRVDVHAAAQRVWDESQSKDGAAVVPFEAMNALHRALLATPATVPEPTHYAGQHDDCIATVPHWHDRPYRVGEWAATFDDGWLRPETGQELRERLSLALRKSDLDWPRRPDLAYAELRTAVRALLSSTDDKVGES